MHQPVLAHLEPKDLYRFFEELCRLPHGSHNTSAASDWVVKFARDRGLRCRRDEVGNVIVWKDATPGYEDHPTVMLQSHLDMVCVKESGVDHDFTADPLELYIEDGFIKARGTSLGGDDGVGVAMALAICHDDSRIPHPPLECVFTIDEEVGMLGARALDCSDLRSHYMLNLDFGIEGWLITSCAGGTHCRMDSELMVSERSGTFVTLEIGGLCGGHSGVAIHRGFANGCKLLGELLGELGCPPIVSLSAGSADNAIPNFGKAVVMVDADKVEAFTASAAAWAEKAKADCPMDPDFTFTCAVSEGREMVHCPVCSRKAVELLLAVPTGVRTMNPDHPDQVQTSLNLGIASVSGGKMDLTFLIRSSHAAEQAAVAKELENIAARYGAAFTVTNTYGPWEYAPHSKLRDTMVDLYTAQYGKAPTVKLLHAGLECGLLMQKLPGLDAISFGPDVMDGHSTRERLGIESTLRTWNLLLAALKAL